MRKTIVFILLLTLVIVFIGCQSNVNASASDDQEELQAERYSLEDLCAMEVIEDGDIWTAVEFHGGDTAKDIKGYIVTVYKPSLIMRYCCYAEVEEIRGDGMYTAEEVEIDADMIDGTIIWGE